MELTASVSKPVYVGSVKAISDNGFKPEAIYINVPSFPFYKNNKYTFNNYPQERVTEYDGPFYVADNAGDGYSYEDDATELGYIGKNTTNTHLYYLGQGKYRLDYTVKFEDRGYDSYVRNLSNSNITGPILYTDGTTSTGYRWK